MRNTEFTKPEETLLPEGVFIYSRTDMKGTIVEANEAFAAISGYAREDMIGQPHNLVRHPDMPKAAFEDMWRDLKHGLPWRGVVKNRRKDGGFYWVVACASPVRENGKVIGFQSVRSRPSRSEISAAEAAYERIRKGDRTLCIRHGRAVPARIGILARLLSEPAQIRLQVISSLLLAIAVIATPWLGLPALTTQLLAALALVLGIAYLTLTLPHRDRDQQKMIGSISQLLRSGDLTCRVAIHRNDTLGVLSHQIDALICALQATIQGIEDSAHQVRQCTRQLADNVNQVNTAADVQSRATAAAAAAVEEVTVAIGEVASHAGQTHQSSERSGETARLGANRSASASITVQSLAETVITSAAQVEELGKRTAEISRITIVIKEIADQTNLLALNAAIEAARAGETGRGFAVVADEVKKLAERTALATEEIAVKLSSIHSDTEQAVQGMRTGARQVEDSVMLVRSAKEALDAITDEMTGNAAMISHISHAASEQRNAMTDLSENINRVAQMTEQNVAVVMQTDDATRLLNSTVDRMIMAVGQYAIETTAA